MNGLTDLIFFLSRITMYSAFVAIPMWFIIYSTRLKYRIPLWFVGCAVSIILIHELSQVSTYFDSNTFWRYIQIQCVFGMLCHEVGREIVKIVRKEKFTEYEKNIQNDIDIALKKAEDEKSKIDNMLFIHEQFKNKKRWDDHKKTKLKKHFYYNIGYYPVNGKACQKDIDFWKKKYKTEIDEILTKGVA